MRLLFVTQAVDTNDPVLGFVHGWLWEFSKHFERITVVCLRKGEHHLPENVHVLSLGKGQATGGKLRYAARFLRHAFREKGSYDAVLVHMNQEYILFAGWFWKLFGTSIYLWRNHYAGSVLTDLAAAFCTNVFCTSKFSYTAKYKKTILMPVGVDTELYKPVGGVQRGLRSVLFLGRLASSKRPELFLEALGMLHVRSAPFVATLCGPGDTTYVESLQRRAEELGISGKVRFLPGVRRTEAPPIFSAHDVFVNLSPSGMLDKTIFEAAACGCTVLASSEDWKELAGEALWFDGSAASLAQKLEQISSDKPDGKKILRSLAERMSLERLGQELALKMQPPVRAM